MKEVFEEDFDIIANDGLLLKGNSWIPDGKVDAVVCLVHGLGEHCKRFPFLIKFLNQKGIAIFSYDQRGHGRSQGKKGDITSFSVLLDDVENLLKMARSEFTDLPIFLHGHSWGGNIVCNYLLKRNTREIAGAVLSAPWFKLVSKPAPSLLFVAYIANKLFPSFTKNNSLLPSSLSKDPKVVNAYINDPLVHPLISIRNYYKTKAAGLWALENTKELKVPTLIIHGKADEITSWQASQEFAEKAPKLVDIKLWKNGKHELHNDLEKDEVFAHLFQWIKSKIPSLLTAEKV